MRPAPVAGWSLRGFLLRRGWNAAGERGATHFSSASPPTESGRYSFRHARMTFSNSSPRFGNRTLAVSIVLSTAAAAPSVARMSSPGWQGSVPSAVPTRTQDGGGCEKDMQRAAEPHLSAARRRTVRNLRAKPPRSGGGRRAAVCVGTCGRERGSAARLFESAPGSSRLSGPHRCGRGTRLNGRGTPFVATVHQLPPPIHMIGENTFYTREHILY